MHGPRHTSQECKVLIIYSEKCAAQEPQKEKEARSGGKYKNGKSVEFYRETQVINTMEPHDDPIANKKKGRIRLKIIRKKTPNQNHQIMGIIMAVVVYT